MYILFSRGSLWISSDGSRLLFCRKQPSSSLRIFLKKDRFGIMMETQAPDREKAGNDSRIFISGLYHVQQRVDMSSTPETE